MLRLRRIPHLSTSRRGWTDRLRFAARLALAALAAPAVAAPAAEDPVVVDCAVVWEAAGETEDYLFGGLLVDAGWDREGNLCVVDYANRDLKVFAADGRYLRTLGRAGEGPGELRDARRLLLAEDGRLGLLQVFPASVVWLHPDGAPGGRTVVRNRLGDGGGYVAVPHMIQAGATILAFASAMSLDGQQVSERQWIAPLEKDGALEHAIFSRSVDQPARDARGRLDEADYYDLWAARWAPDGRGGVWLAADRDRYRLVRQAPGGAVVETVARAYEPVVRDELGRRRALERLGRKRLAAEEIELRDTAPVVRSLRASDGGPLWVDLDLGGRGPVPGTIALLDVLDRDGSWGPRLLLRGPYDPETDQWCFVDDAHLLVLHAGADGEVVLRLLRWAMP